MRIGVDTGGTFTDFVAVGGDGAVRVLKVASTPHDPGRAVVDGVARLAAGETVSEVVHGTTVATNALLTRSGGPTALVTTRGFEDVIEIGRQARPDLYALHPRKSASLVPPGMRLGVRERVGADGVVIEALDGAETARAVEAVRARGATSVAVSLLHAYLRDEHERRLGEALRGAGLMVSLSCDVMPEFREYERTSTTCADAYVAPIVSRYLASLADRLRTRLRVLQSNGGALSAAEAACTPVRTVLSGPAAGVLGARAVARRTALRLAITLDMGGTSTDVAVLAGDAVWTTATVIAGVPIGVPSIEVHTVGAGGGSIARLDEGGALRVGPESAGAEPGPACYGHGDAATVTDADLALGRLGESLAGGALRLDAARGRAALDRLGVGAGGVVRVVNASIARAVRALTVERGLDPREMALVAFGGAGPLHACELAEELGVAHVVVPAGAGLLCAWGALSADVVRDYARTVLRAWPCELDTADLEARAASDLEAEGVSPQRRRLERRADLRYVGQSYELTVPWDHDAGARFEEAHRARYGFAMPGRGVEIVALRLRAVGEVDAPPPLPGWEAPGARVEGPRVLSGYDATVYVAPGWVGEADGDGHLHLRRPP